MNRIILKNLKVSLKVRKKEEKLPLKLSKVLINKSKNQGIIRFLIKSIKRLKVFNLEVVKKATKKRESRVFLTLSPLMRMEKLLSKIRRIPILKVLIFLLQAINCPISKLTKIMMRICRIKWTPFITLRMSKVEQKWERWR